MAPIFFRRSLLALTIAGIATPALATQIALTNSGITLENAAYNENTEVTGNYDRNDLARQEGAVAIKGTTFEKDLTINANISGSTEKNSDQAEHPDYQYVYGIGLNVYEPVFDKDDPTAISAETKVKGDLVNNADVSINGAGARALLIHNDVVIEGSVINNGSLEAHWDDSHHRTASGIGIAGTAEALGSAPVINGDLINSTSGKIITSGKDSVGINLEGAKITGKLINNGEIIVNGEESKGIELDALVVDYNNWLSRNTEIHSIENNGKIIATGDSTKGIYIRGTKFIEQGYPEGVYSDQVKIVNNGEINAATGIYVDNDQNSFIFVDNSGIIKSDQSAIDAKGAVALDFLGGEISGRLTNLYLIEVSGDATYNGLNNNEFDIIVDNIPDEAKQLGLGWVEIGGDNNPVTLKLGKEHTSIKGSLYINQGSSVELNISEKTQADKPILLVSGIAELSEGSSIKLSTQSEDFVVGGKKYVLLQAGEIQNKGVEITSSSLLLNIEDFDVTSTEVVATVSSKSKDEVEDVIEDIGGSDNAQKAGANFGEVAALLAERDPSDPVFLAYMAASEDPEALMALTEQFSAEVNGGNTHAALTNITQINNTVSNRTASIRGASSGDALQETGAWVQTLYSDASQNKRDGVAGFNAYSRGIALGADGKLNDQLTLGLAYSFLHTSVNSKNGNKTDVDGNALTLYAGFEEGNYFVDSNISYGFNKNKSHRSIANTRAKGTYDSKTLSADVTAGYTYNVNSQLALEPRATARYARIDIDSFREKGSSAALKTKHQRYEVAELGAGARLVGNFPMGNGMLQPQLTAMAYHDLAADRIKSTSTFVLGNTPFVSQGAKAVRNSYEATVGADYRLGALTLGANYSYTGKTSYHSDTVTAKVRYDF